MMMMAKKKAQAVVQEQEQEQEERYAFERNAQRRRQKKQRIIDTAEPSISDLLKDDPQAKNEVVAEPDKPFNVYKAMFKMDYYQNLLVNNLPRFNWLTHYEASPDYEKELRLENKLWSDNFRRQVFNQNVNAKGGHNLNPDSASYKIGFYLSLVMSSKVARNHIFRQFENRDIPKKENRDRFKLALVNQEARQREPFTPQTAALVRLSLDAQTYKKAMRIKDRSGDDYSSLMAQYEQAQQNLDELVAKDGVDKKAYNQAFYQAYSEIGNTYEPVKRIYRDFNIAGIALGSDSLVQTVKRDGSLASGFPSIALANQQVDYDKEMQPIVLANAATLVNADTEQEAVKQEKSFRALAHKQKQAAQELGIEDDTDYSETVLREAYEQLYQNEASKLGSYKATKLMQRTTNFVKQTVSGNANLAELDYNRRQYEYIVDNSLAKETEPSACLQAKNHLNQANIIVRASLSGTDLSPNEVFRILDDETNKLVKQENQVVDAHNANLAKGDAPLKAIDPDMKFHNQAFTDANYGMSDLLLNSKYCSPADSVKRDDPVGSKVFAPEVNDLAKKVTQPKTKLGRDSQQMIKDLSEKYGAAGYAYFVNAITEAKVVKNVVPKHGLMKTNNGQYLNVKPADKEAVAKLVKKMSHNEHGAKDVGVYVQEFDYKLKQNTKNVTLLPFLLNSEHMTRAEKADAYDQDHSVGRNAPQKKVAKSKTRKTTRRKRKTVKRESTKQKQARLTKERKAALKTADTKVENTADKGGIEL